MNELKQAKIQLRNILDLLKDVNDYQIKSSLVNAMNEIEQEVKDLEAKQSNAN